MAGIERNNGHSKATVDDKIRRRTLEASHPHSRRIAPILRLCVVISTAAAGLMIGTRIMPPQTEEGNQYPKPSLLPPRHNDPEDPSSPPSRSTLTNDELQSSSALPPEFWNIFPDGEIPLGTPLIVHINNPLTHNIHVVELVSSVDGMSLSINGKPFKLFAKIIGSWKAVVRITGVEIADGGMLKISGVSKRTKLEGYSVWSPEELQSLVTDVLQGEESFEFTLHTRLGEKVGYLRSQ